MVTFNVAKKILNKKENKYNDEQIKAIIELINLFASMNIKQFLKQ